MAKEDHLYMTNQSFHESLDVGRNTHMGFVVNPTEQNESNHYFNSSSIYQTDRQPRRPVSIEAINKHRTKMLQVKPKGVGLSNRTHGQ